ncbi:MAG: recombinase family protein [Candidatus Omnitrophota bacterium]
MKVALYTRVSTEDQAREGFSLEVQRNYLLQYAKNFGWDVFCSMSGRDVYMDDGYSGGNMDRPALQRLLFDARNKHFDLILVYKQDRLSRRLKDLLGLLEEFDSLGIGYKSATEPFDSTTSAGKLMFQQLGSFAEFERNRIAERVFLGMVKGVQQGNWQGARYAPYGYNYNKEKKLLEADEKEEKVVKLIYTMFLCDKSIFAIAEYLTKKGCRNRKGNIFSTKLIGDILRNRIYTGKLVWNRHYYDKTQKTKKGYRYIKNPPDKIIISQGKHQPIIPDDDFEAVQEKLKTRRIERRKKANDYPLSGILYCAKCNHKYLGISSISNHRTGVKKRWYRCVGPYRSFIRCKNKSVKANEIESEVAGLLETLLKSDKLKTSRWTNVTFKNDANFPIFEKISKTDLEKVKNRLENNLKKQSKLTDAYLENLLSEELYKQKNEGLRNEEEELKKLIALQEVREIERERSKEYLNRVEEFLDGYNPNKKTMDLETKKLILNLLFKNIKIAQKKIFSFSFFAPFNFLFFEEKEKSQCQTNQKLIKKIRSESVSRLSDVR